MASIKARENRLRRVARRRGLRLAKSRRRDTGAPDYGLYWVADSDWYLVSPDEGMTLDETEAWLSAWRSQREPVAICMACRS